MKERSCVIRLETTSNYKLLCLVKHCYDDLFAEMLHHLLHLHHCNIALSSCSCCSSGGWYCYPDGLTLGQCLLEAVVELRGKKKYYFVTKLGQRQLEKKGLLEKTLVGSGFSKFCNRKLHTWHTQ